MTSKMLDKISYSIIFGKSMVEQGTDKAHSINCLELLLSTSAKLQFNFVTHST